MLERSSPAFALNERLLDHCFYAVKDLNRFFDRLNTMDVNPAISVQGDVTPTVGKTRYSEFFSTFSPIVKKLAQYLH